MPLASLSLRDDRSLRRVSGVRLASVGDDRSLWRERGVPLASLSLRDGRSLWRVRGLPLVDGWALWRVLERGVLLGGGRAPS